MRLLILLISLVCLTSFYPNCNNSGIKKVWLFSQTQTGGTIRLDADGNKVDNRTYNHFLIIEVKKNKQITCDSILYQGKFYAVKSVLIADNKVTVGNIIDDKPFTISAAKNRALIRLDIQDMNFSLSNNESYELTLSGKAAGENFNYTFNKINLNLLPVLYQ